MGIRARAALALLLSPLPASADPGVYMRVESILAQARVQGIAAPPLSGVPVPAPAKSAPAAPLLTPEAWARMPAPSADILDWLARRSPELDPAAVRELTPAAGAALFEDALQRGLSALDLFTDAGFRGREVFYVPQELIAALFARYQANALTQVEGTATDGSPFVMEALLLGGGRIEALYDRAHQAENPAFPGHVYILERRVVQRILAPGDMSVEGITVRYGIFRPVIQRLTRVPPDHIRVQTNYGDRDRARVPLGRR